MFKHMTEQPRQPAGTAPTLKGRRPGGQYIPKKQPHTKPENIYFDDDVYGIGVPLDWDKRDVRVRGSRTVFERIVETDETGNESVTITSTCDGPELLFLARKGDPKYWNGDTWAKDHKTRRTWCADITLTMLREGAISTGYGAGVEGAQTAMTAAASQRRPRKGWGAHVLTGTVAQIRGLRVLQSVAPQKDWNTKLGGFKLPSEVDDLLCARFDNIVDTYHSLPRPPWNETDPPGTPWGPQPVAGQATNRWDQNVFVGENSDLLWRALTEPVRGGMSPLKAGLVKSKDRYTIKDMVTAAALYDETAAAQLTTDLTAGVDTDSVDTLRTNILKAFTEALNPGIGKCRWNEQQQHKLRGFIKILETDQR